MADRMKALWHGTLAGAALALMILAPARAEEAEAEAAIRARFDAFADAFNKGDAAGACSIYADDLVAIWPGAADADKAATCDRLSKVLGDTSRDITYSLDIEEVLLGPSGDFAAVRSLGTLGIEEAGAVTTSQDRRLDILARGPDGEWRIRRAAGFPAEAAPR